MLRKIKEGEMVFSSLLFLFAYLPIVLLCYYAAPRKWRNTVLFAVSLFFYGWSEPIYLFLMLGSLTSAYLFGFLIARDRENFPHRARLWTILSVCINLGILFFFKYYNFFAENLSRLPIIDLPILVRMTLPIGISFYSFQIISYTVDLYRGDCRLQKSYIAFGTYVTLFPQLVAGPIVRYHDIDDQLSTRQERLAGFSEGISRFCAGLAKKVILGDALAAGSDYYRRLAELEPTAIGAWMTVVLYTLHLYYDFSGYSDMAIGLGRMFGFHFPENFNYPYISRSITEFWRRWHISLSTWFREYVYIPLGGNRRGKLRMYRNLVIVWFLTGFWHGANWNFMLWGIYFALILILEKAFFLKLLKKLPRILQHIYAILLVLFGFLIFSYPNLRQALSTATAMLGRGVPLVSDASLYQLLRLMPLVLIAAVGSTPIPRMLWDRLRIRRTLAPPVCAAMLLLCTAYLVDSTFSPFAYTQF